MVDRDRDLCRMVALAFELVGDVAISCFDDVERAVHACRLGPRDIVVLDGDLGRRAAQELVEALEAWPGTGTGCSSVRAVILTTGAVSLPGELAHHPSVGAVVSKPFDPAELVATVLALCPEHAGRQAEAAAPKDG